MIEGWGFNPPPNWPRPPGGWMPPPGWQPDPAWGPVPPGWQLWVPDDRKPRRRGVLPAAGVATLLLIAVAAAAVPREPGPGADDPRASGSALVGEPLRAALPAPPPTASSSGAAARGSAASSPTTSSPTTSSPTASSPPASSSGSRAAPSTPAATQAEGSAARRSDSPPLPAEIRSYSTCSALNRVYPNGIGLPGAVDRVVYGTPVTNFGRSTSLYRANKAHDRDRDGVACEPS